MKKWIRNSMFLVAMLFSLSIISCGPTKHEVVKTPGTLGFQKDLCYITLINDSNDNMEVKIESFDSTDPVYQQLLSPGHKALIQLPKADYDLYSRKMDFAKGFIGEWDSRELLLSYKRKCRLDVKLRDAYFNAPYYRGGPSYENLR